MFDNLLGLIFGTGTIGTTVNSITAYASWAGRCVTGDCGVTPPEVTEMLTGIGSNLPNTTGFIGNLISKPLALIFNFLPDGGGFPTVFHTASIYFGNTLASVNWLLPVADLIYCVSFVFSIQLMLWGLHIMRVFVSFIRGIPVDRFSGGSQMNAVYHLDRDF